jgi:hypothetical protein
VWYDKFSKANGSEIWSGGFAVIPNAVKHLMKR